jgi:hypothetical protein
VNGAMRMVEAVMEGRDNRAVCWAVGRNRIDISRMVLLGRVRAIMDRAERGRKHGLGMAKP